VPQIAVFCSPMAVREATFRSPSLTKDGLFDGTGT
jgi:hypothetical protein